MILRNCIGLIRSNCYYPTMPDEQPRKWYQIRWFSDQDTPEERKLIMKLDLIIVPYVFLAYWVKYIDQTNLSEASSHFN